MNNYQIGVLTILGILTIIGYFRTALSKTDGKRLGFIVLWLFTSAITLMLVITMTTEREYILKQLKGKCPEYQKIENVYQLKK